MLKDEKDLIKLRCTNKHKEVYHRQDLLCSFGTSDLNINNNCNIDYDSRSRLGRDYECPPDKDKQALAGSLYFKVIEIEVFKLIWK